MTKPRQRSARAERTRAALIAAARQIFERDGYVEAKITDITGLAQVAAGTFYTHFTDKREVFAAVVGELNHEMLHPALPGAAGSPDSTGEPASDSAEGPASDSAGEPASDSAEGPASDSAGEPPGPAAQIRAANLAYLRAYRDNAALMHVLGQVATFDAEFRELRLTRSHAFHTRTAAQIKTWQSDGIADASLDPQLTAAALSAMVSRLAYQYFVLETEPSVPVEQLADVVSDLWLNALRIGRA